MGIEAPAELLDAFEGQTTINSSNTEQWLYKISRNTFIKSVISWIASGLALGINAVSGVGTT